MTTKKGTKPKAIHLNLNRLGWALSFPPNRNGGQEEVVSQMPDTWRDRLDEMAPNIVGTNTRTVPEHEIVKLAVCGPMIDLNLPPGMMRAAGGSARIPWKDVPRNGADPRFGNAHGLTSVALDVYVTIVQRFGGETFDPHAAQTS